MSDKLIVNGLGKPLDGEYEFSLVDIISVGTPGSLTNREAHRIKVMTASDGSTGIRAGEIMDAIVAGDNDILVALSVVILARTGKVFSEETIWDAQVGSLDWDLEALRKKDGDEESPPAEPAATPETETLSANGGESSSSTLGLQASDPSLTGRLGSPTSAVYAHLTSVS